VENVVLQVLALGLWLSKEAGEADPGVGIGWHVILEALQVFPCWFSTSRRRETGSLARLEMKSTMRVDSQTRSGKVCDSRKYCWSVTSFPAAPGRRRTGI
jgi:hypothetical protein